jgi:hypothetical protein
VGLLSIIGALLSAEEGEGLDSVLGRTSPLGTSGRGGGGGGSFGGSSSTDGFFSPPSGSESAGAVAVRPGIFICDEGNFRGVDDCSPLGEGGVVVLIGGSVGMAAWFPKLVPDGEDGEPKRVSLSSFSSRAIFCSNVVALSSPLELADWSFRGVGITGRV